jgi:hypothetical protein
MPSGPLPRHEQVSAARAGGAAYLWPLLAALVSLVPVLPGFSSNRVFYVRDLSSFFWGRYLWVRHAWLSGSWPLWDPHVGAGQAAYADALHQMFLLPAVLVRLVGGEVLGFNLWIVTPFPIAAVGAWLFFARRLSGAAAALGAIAFAVCGPVASSGDFPNLSWSVAMLPWVLWATDRLVSDLRPREVAVVAFAVAGQCLAGEPVTLFTTVGAAILWAATMTGQDRGFDLRASARNVVLSGAGIALGVALSAIQLLPMTVASAMAERADAIVPDAWSLRPTALLETVWLHLFGNYFETQSLSDVPWMPLMFTGREPLLFSLYFGTPLLALSLYGLAGRAPRRLRLFWVVAGLASLVGAFGSYTPIYPLLRDHVPPFGTFRFPVKYVFVAVMAVAAGAALGIEELLASASREADPSDVRREARARFMSLGFAAGTGVLIAAFAGACRWFPVPASSAMQAYARLLGDESGKAAAYMLQTAPMGSLPVLGVTAAATLLLAVIYRDRAGVAGRAGVLLLAVLVTADLVVHAWGVNPVMDATRFAEPTWLGYTKSDPNTRFYVGGKLGGSLEAMDFDSSRGFERVPGLPGSASRAALSIQAAFYPSGWGGRELLSYDLPVLWPRLFAKMAKRFEYATREERDRFLDRMAVRFRVLPQRRAGDLTPTMPVPQFLESFLFDFGNRVGTRASVVADVRLMPDPERQIEALFEPGWDSRRLALIEHDLTAVGTPGAAVEPYATITSDDPNSTVIDVGTGPGGGYLVLLDSYDADWRTTVDGRPATTVRADGLFRALRLTEGRHVVRFDYRPRALWWGASVSFSALLAAAGLWFVDRRVAGPRPLT